MLFLSHFLMFCDVYCYHILYHCYHFVGIKALHLFVFSGWEKKNKLSIFKETLPGKLEKNASKRGIEAGTAENTKSTKNIENIENIENIGNIENIKSLKASKGWN